MGFIQLGRWRVRSLGLMLGLLTGCGMIRITGPVGWQLVALDCGSGFRVKAWQGLGQTLSFNASILGNQEMPSKIKKSPQLTGSKGCLGESQAQQVIRCQHFGAAFETVVWWYFALGALAYVCF